MKKAQAKKFMLLAIFSLIFLVVFFITFIAREGLFGSTVDEIPKMINDTITSIQGRPASNTAYLINSIHNAYTFSQNRINREVCFYEIEEINSRLLTGYVSINQSGDDVIIKFNVKDLDGDEDPYLPITNQGKLCVVSGGIANDLVYELNRRNWFRRNIVTRPFTLGTPPAFLNELQLETSSSGINQTVIDGQRYDHISTYMLYYNGNICFIPYTIYHGDCRVHNNVFNQDCITKMRRFTC